MNVLDLYCGAGGATRGMQLAGCTVTGVDAKPQPRYIGDHFLQRDALSLGLDFLRQFDFIFASPPCQSFVPMCDRSAHPNLIPKTRNLLNAAGVPWIIENVPSAPLIKFITLCGTMGVFPFLRVFRHRRFEFSDDLSLREPTHMSMGEHPKVFSFDRRGARLKDLNEWEGYVTVAGNNCSLGAASDAMGINWMTRPEIAQAVPPVYSRFLVRQVQSNLAAQKDAL